ncbi:MAG: PKD domain-containing protein [Prevotella sp.]|nr:PKD domain-containing protein [Prevotella sp.]
MKRNKFTTLRLFAIFGLLSLFGCAETDIVDFDYPSSRIYLPIATKGSITTDGVYNIDEGASTRWVSPTEGQPLKYDVDLQSNQLIIPLGVARSGQGNEIATSQRVDIILDNDTILKLIDQNKLGGAMPIPANLIEIPSNIDIVSGSSNAVFNVVAKLRELKALETGKYAFAIRIGHNDAINESLAVGVVVINTVILNPKADFTASLAGSSTTLYSFQNTSQYWDFFSGNEPFTWSFGDGSADSHEINPQHDFKNPGTYTVSLKVNGPVGDNAIISKDIKVK